MPKRHPVSSFFFKYAPSFAGIVGLVMVAVYVADSAYWLLNYWPTESKRIDVRAIGLASILVFASGLYYFARTTRRQKEQDALEKAGAIFNSLISQMTSMQKEGIPMLDHYEKAISVTEDKIKEWEQKFDRRLLERRLTDIVNDAEGIALGIRYDSFDEDVTYDLFGPPLLVVWKILEDFIERARKEKYYRSFGWELEWLNARWYSRQIRGMQKELDARMSGDR